MSESNQAPEPDLFSALAPYLAGAVLVSVALVLAVMRFAPSFAAPVSVAVVSFDIVKYTNAQRAVASTFIKRDVDVSATNELLLNLPERTRSAINAVAGPGALVVVKQAVVQGQTTDITDEVLTRLGLPTNVPTADAAAYSLDVAPTNFFGVSPRPLAPASNKQPSTGPVALP